MTRSDQFSSDRTFRLWDLTISHRSLLLRSPQDAVHQRNLDVVFAGVAYVESAATLNGARLVPPEPGELDKVTRALGKSVADKELFVLASGASRLLVVAVAMAFAENDLDFTETSLVRFGAR